MKREIKHIITGAALLAATTVMGQSVVQVGKGSYASYTPLSKSKTTTHGGDQSQFMQYRKLNLHERAGQPIPTNDWWTNMINGGDHATGEEITGHLWSYPLYVQARKGGLDIKYPSYWMDNGTEMLANTKVVITGLNFNPDNGSAVAQSWHDWDVAFSLTDGSKLMYTTMVSGMPFTWVEMRDIVPSVKIVRDDRSKYAVGNMSAELLQQDGVTALADGDVTDGFVVGMTDAADGMTPEYYGVFLPENTTVRIIDGAVRLLFSGKQQYVVVGLLPSKGDYAAFAPYAYNVPRDTEVSWNYDVAAGKLRTHWNITAENLLTGVSIPDFGTGDNAPAVADEPNKPADDGTVTVPVGDDGYTGPAHAPRRYAPSTSVKCLQGFLPHHYRDYSGSAALPGAEKAAFRTPHGVLKLVEGTSFEIDYDFFGMLPYYPLPNASDYTGKAYTYNEDMMLTMLRQYANTGTFGDDTYWGGKGLTQMALNMMFAREMGQKELFQQCHDKLKAALVDWLTYTPGESTKFFAYDNRFGGMIGYDTSYDSDTYNDHHFHYGYFTLAGAMLALVDKDFRDNYGEMMTLIAKDYANWDKTDTRFPYFRMFTPWAGHSFAGGMGDGNGNGQESTSEAMQGWGGVYLLGVALGDNAMRDAGIFGWVSEARATAEYWFDRHKDDSRNMANFHSRTYDDYGNGYNIDYSKFQSTWESTSPAETGKAWKTEEKRNDKGEWMTNDEGEYLYVNYMTPPYNSNFTCHGVGYWTYFGFDAIFMQGIQWMPISPALDYLSEDKDFVEWDMQRMLGDTFHNGFLDNTGDATLANSDWGNVALAYWQRSNPEQVADIFQQGWDAGYKTYTTSATNGITYFTTHSHATIGDIDWTIKGSIPTSRVYNKNGVKTYTAFNPTDAAIAVTFSDGGKLTVPAHELAVSGKTTLATPFADFYYSDAADEDDPRDELVMENLALNKTATTSGNENDITQGGNQAVDGKESSRWASLKDDGQWITVDLGKDAIIYKVNILWEAAYAASYQIQLSADGNTWTPAATESGAANAWVETKIGDQTARYIRVECLERSNVAYGISIYELQVFGQWADAAADDLLGVKITSSKPTLTQYEESQVSIKGYTVGKQWVDVVPVWSSKDGKITTDGKFTPRVSPEATVKATVGNLTASKTLPVEEALFTAYLTLSPSSIEVPVGEAYQLTVDVKNQFGEPMKVNLNNVTWRVCTYVAREEQYMDGETQKTRTVYDLTDSDKGTVSADGKVTFTATGDYAIVATDGEGSDMIFATVKDYADINLALYKPAEATSEYGDAKASKAVDGDTGSSWETYWPHEGKTDAEVKEELDNQDFTVNLEGVYSINKVKVLWENARPQQYELQVSVDGINFNTIKTLTNSPVNPIWEEITLPETNAQYVRMHGIERRTEYQAYGYKMFEFEVYGTEKVAEASAQLRDNGLDATINAHTLAGVWNDDDFAAIDAANMEESDKPVAYDLRGVSIKEGTSFNIQNPNALVMITAEQADAHLVTNSKNVVVCDGGNYTAKNIEFTDGNRVNNIFGTGSVPSLTAHEVSYERTLKSTYATLALPYDCALPESGMTVYAFDEYTESDNEIRIHFEEVESPEKIEAGKPYLIEADATGITEWLTAQDSEINFTGKPENVKSGSITFLPSFSYMGNIPAGNNYYSLKANDDKLLYHYVNGTIPEFRSYFQIQESAAAKSLIVEFGDEATGGVRRFSDEALSAIFNIYSIDGKLVKSNSTSLIGLKAGVYIINGKKTVVK